MPSRFLPIQPGTEPAQQLAMINKNFAELDNENVTKLFYDANGVPSIMIGVQPDRTSRIRIAEDGVDVTTATDDQLAFNSAQSVLKIVSSGESQMPVASGSGFTNYENVVQHDLGFVPIPLVFVTPPSGSGYTIQQLPYTIFTFSLGSTTAPDVNAHIVAAVDDTYLTIDLTAKTTISSFVGAWTFKYYLLQETAN